MRLRVDTAIGIGGLLAVQLVAAFAAVGLLARTSPAIERLLQEDRSLAAVERALGVLATDGDPGAFDAAIAEARRHVTDPEELPLLDRVQASRGAAFAGDARARTELVATLSELSAVNRASMERLDEQARFLGRAGAWATALLGSFGFLLSVIVYRRVRARVEEPILAIDRTLQAVRAGDTHRRCSTREGPTETRRIAENANWLLDRLEQDRRPPSIEEDRTDRLLLVALLDRHEEPVIALDPQGRPMAVNKAALALWDETGDPTAELALAIRDGGEAPGWTIERIESAKAFLCRRTGAS